MVNNIGKPLNFPMKMVQMGSETTDTDNGNLAGDAFLVVPNHPLLISRVLATLFENVDYEALKSCRLVCKTWKEVSDLKYINDSALKYCGREIEDMKSPRTFELLFKSVEINNKSKNVENNKVRFAAFNFFQVELNISI